MSNEPNDPTDAPQPQQTRNLPKYRGRYNGRDTSPQLSGLRRAGDVTPMAERVDCKPQESTHRPHPNAPSRRPNYNQGGGHPQQPSVAERNPAQPTATRPVSAGQHLPDGHPGAGAEPVELAQTPEPPRPEAMRPGQPSMTPPPAETSSTPAPVEPKRRRAAGNEPQVQRRAHPAPTAANAPQYSRSVKQPATVPQNQGPTQYGESGREPQYVRNPKTGADPHVPAGGTPAATVASPVADAIAGVQPSAAQLRAQLAEAETREAEEADTAPPIAAPAASSGPTGVMDMAELQTRADGGDAQARTLLDQLEALEAAEGGEGEDPETEDGTGD